MNDEQQEKQPTQKFASIQKQFETIGGGKDMQDAIMQERQDVKTLKRYDAGDMKRLTVYMPAGLARWLKVHAAFVGDDISGIITGLVAKYKDEVEKKNK
jgi:hypothetical protein